MACRVFGVANHSPEEVVSSLLKTRIATKASEIGILPVLSRADTRFKYLLLLSTTDFTRNLSRFDNSDIYVFVFSNPIDLAAFSGINHLDFTAAENAFSYSDLNMQMVSKSTPRAIKRVGSKFLPKLIDSVSHGSMLNPLMTFIYALSSQNQNTVKAAAINFLYHGHTIQKLCDNVSLCLTERAADKLIAILDTSIGKSYSEALQQIRQMKKQNEEVNFEDVAKATSTSAYELSYMMSIIADMKENYTDSLDKAKNRKAVGKTPKLRKA